MAPKAARMLDSPGATAVAKPCVPGVLLTVATLVADELQVTTEFRFWLLLSL
jgi:hypothetical protein